MKHGGVAGFTLAGTDLRPRGNGSAGRISKEKAGRRRRHRPSAVLILALLGAGLAGVLPGQTITEFTLPVAGSGPYEIVTGSDGNLWFTESTGNKVARITTAGVVTEFTLPVAGSQPYGIAAGSDGNLWFPESRGQSIGRITTAGVLTEFPTITPLVYPFGIAAGPDGNLWFTENSGNQIGRITTAGVMTEFPIPTAGSAPYDIAAGPDGNLWFTEPLSNNIGRITTAGVITEFPVPTTTSHPAGIATGPDGNLWFTENSGNNVGRITTAGAVTEFPIPTAVSAPYTITAGPDGNLWFAEGNGNAIGRISTAGVVTEFPIPTAASYPVGIAVGPDANLWFTELNGNQIGRVVLCPPITLSPASLPGGTLGTAYNQTITASGGTGPYSFLATAGTLPPGLKLTAAGVLSGTPTANGTSMFTVKATDANGCTGSQSYTVVVSCPPITLSPASLPGGSVGSPYTVTITATGGTAPYSYATAGTLPPGLTFAAGVLSGTPTANGTSVFAVTATDASGCTGTASYTVTIGGGCPSIDLNPTTLPNARVGVPYSQTVAATGGAAPYTFSVTGLPAGLTFSQSGPQSVLLSGTPTTLTGIPTPTVTVTATDTNGCSGSRGFSIAVSNCSTIAISPAALPSGSPGAPYRQVLSATGGAGPFTFALASGSLPAGLTISPSGVIAGTPTSAGDFSFKLTATDAAGCIGTGNYSMKIVVAGGFMISALTPASAISGSGPFTLTVDGMGFASGSVVTWNGSPRPTTFVSDTRLTAAIPASDVTATGSAQVTVVNPGPIMTTPIAFTICDLPAAPSNPQIANASNPSGPVTGADPLLLSWGPPATGPAPRGYEYRINGDAYAPTNATSVTAPARGSNDPVQLFVRAVSCVPDAPGPDATTLPVAPAAPGSDFVVPSNVQVGQAATFTDTSSPQATSWLWIFDDEETSTVQSPTHVFTQAGNHKVALIASNGSGSEVKIQTVVVAPATSAPGIAPASVLLQADQPGRSSLRWVRLSGPGRTWLILSSDSGAEEVVFLRLIDAAGSVRLERRLVLEAGQEAINDIGAWGVTGTFTVEAVTSGRVTARLRGANVVREQVVPAPHPRRTVGGAR
jgi:streptogramin lyase/PKD repeat protein